MRTRLEFIVVIEHDPDYNPMEHWVWYFDDMAPESETFVVVESWEDV